MLSSNVQSQAQRKSKGPSVSRKPFESASGRSAFSSVSKIESQNQSKRSPQPKEQQSRAVLQKCLQQIKSIDFEHFSSGEAADGSDHTLSIVLGLGHLS